MVRPLLPLALVLAACAGDASDPIDGDVSRDLGSSSDGAIVPPGGCTVGDGYCLAYNIRHACVARPSGSVFVDETCAAGAGCLAGACTPMRCSDECTLGETSASGTCALWDIAAASWPAADPAGSMHDRARAYTARLRRDGLPYGGLGHARYSDPGTWQTVETVHGLGDSALHSGEYFAAEAMRLAATGSADARDHVKKGVETMHRWFNVSGYPGVLARHAVPASADLANVMYDCGNANYHCDVAYDGGQWSYIGHVSRDQYQGVMLAYGLAYDALSPDDEASKALIRQDVVELVEELMKERTVQVKLVYNNTTLPAATVKMRFAVIVGNELDNGALLLKYGGGDDTWRGFQEFIPNLADLLKQVVGPLSPARVPRSGSAIMLSSFFRLALHVTDGAPTYAARRKAIEDFYRGNTGLGGNINDWMAIAADFSPNDEGSDGCGKGYYSNNINLQPLYNWARLETDPAVLDFALSLVEQKAWPELAPTKNVFFTFMLQGVSRAGDPSAVTAAATQLAGFGPPPRSRVMVDNLANPKYTQHQSSCTDQLVHTQAVDVADRLADEFIWQNHPWGLYFPGDPAQTFAGGDYLVAYWLGRHHQFLSDDRPTTCARWK